MVWNFSKANKLMPGDCSPKHDPVSFTVLNNFFCLDVMQPFKTIQVYGWAALPNIPCHSPAHFAVLRNHFVVMLCRLSTTFKSTAGRAPPNMIRLISRCQTGFSFGWYEAFQKHSILWLGRAPPNTAQFLSRCWRTFFVWMLCTRLKPFKFMAGPRSPTSPVTAQLISRRWKIFSSWRYADCQQRLNERLVVVPQTRSSFFHSVKAFSRLDGMNLFKNDQVNAWGLLPQTRPSFIHGVEQLFSSGCYAAI